MTNLFNATHSNSKVNFTEYHGDDKKYLADLDINGTVIKSSTDVDSLIMIIKNLNRILDREYEQWIASDYDEQYGWDFVPDSNVGCVLLDAIDEHKVLYIKVIDNKAINIYSEDCTDRNKIILSFSVISD